ncbi:Glycoside hydrolase, 38 vacuolar alpha mannosidase [Marasmius sp. AFHP31]|nr:Glycoside hydrolase, 38 vacuolar alpha mannosidase [Marasmius sp. AFHP31]
MQHTKRSLDGFSVRLIRTRLGIWLSSKSGHKYADLSEYGYGVAILSESKYGFLCRGNVRISLLRAATAPDTEQDQGKYVFSWAVMPHLGHFLPSDVPVAGVQCNIRNQFDDAPNVFVETIKCGEYDTYEDSEDSDHSTSSKPTVSVVLRLYEAYGGHAQALLKLGYAEDIDKVYLTNLMEDEESKLGLVESDEKDILGVKLGFHGFEVETVKIVLKSSRFLKGGE